MSNTMIYSDLAMEVTTFTGVIVHATNNQQYCISDDEVLTLAAEDGSFSSDIGRINLNKKNGTNMLLENLHKKLMKKMVCSLERLSSFPFIKQA